MPDWFRLAGLLIVSALLAGCKPHAPAVSSAGGTGRAATPPTAPTVEPGAVARDAIFNDITDVMDRSAASLNRVKDPQSAAAAVEVLKQQAGRTRRLAHDLRELGKVSRQENNRLRRHDPVLNRAAKNFQAEHQGYQNRLAAHQVTLPAELENRLDRAVRSLTQAMAEFSRAAEAVAPRSEPTS